MERPQMERPQMERYDWLQVVGDRLQLNRLCRYRSSNVVKALLGRLCLPQDIVDHICSFDFWENQAILYDFGNGQPPVPGLYIDDVALVCNQMGVDLSIGASMLKKVMPIAFCELMRSGGNLELTLQNMKLFLADSNISLFCNRSTRDKYLSTIIDLQGTPAEIQICELPPAVEHLAIPPFVPSCIIVVLGMQGCGKTYLISKLVSSLPESPIYRSYHNPVVEHCSSYPVCIRRADCRTTIDGLSYNHPTGLVTVIFESSTVMFQSLGREWKPAYVQTNRRYFLSMQSRFWRFVSRSFRDYNPLIVAVTGWITLKDLISCEKY
jgi:hypothetical protein